MFRGKRAKRADRLASGVHSLFATAHEDLTEANGLLKEEIYDNEVLIEEVIVCNVAHKDNHARNKTLLDKLSEFVV